MGITVVYKAFEVLKTVGWVKVTNSEYNIS